MSRWRITLLLAGWEFRRFFKWKSQLIGWGIGVLLMVGLQHRAHPFEGPEQMEHLGGVRRGALGGGAMP